MPKRVFVLLPPSEAKVQGGVKNRRRDEFADSLSESRKMLNRALFDHMDRDLSILERTLKARGPLLKRSVDANRATASGFGPYLPAWQRYAGVVWVHLDPTSLNAGQRQMILVPSALYGLTTGRDDIGDYRLAMNASVTGTGPLATFWREAVTNTLEKHCRGGIVVNLLTTEFVASVDIDRLGRTTSILNVRFVSADEDRAVGHDAKAVKGFLARRILLEGLSAADEFNWMGWTSKRLGDEIVVVAPRLREMTPPSRRK